MNLSDIKARAEAATAGPWTQNIIDGQTSCQVYAGGSPVAFADNDVAAIMKNVPYEGYPSPAKARANAAFIAHAREDIPFLLALVARLEAENAQWKVSSAEWSQQANDKAQADAKTIKCLEAENAALRGALDWIQQQCPQTKPHTFDDMYGEETENLHINQALWPLGDKARAVLRERGESG